MKRQLTEAAQVAKLIKAELKRHGIMCTAKSSNYSMGDSVRVAVTDQPPWVMKKIEAFTDKYQYGNFNGMEDIYEYTNSRDDIPQTKYLFIENDYTIKLCQLAWDQFRHTESWFNDYPVSYEKAREHDYSQPGFHELGRKMHQYLNGCNLYQGPQFCYFQKERIAA